MKKRLPSNSASAAIKAAISAASPLPEMPKHVRLREKDMPFCEDILRSRAREEWTASDLVVAAQLARCQSDIETESEALEAEGSVIENGRGTPVMNPRHSVLEQLARREMAMMRSLQMVGSARGPREDLEKSRKLQRQAEAAREELQDDNNLLAM
jgi:hypothetical protein